VQRLEKVAAEVALKGLIPLECEVKLAQAEVEQLEGRREPARERLKALVEYAQGKKLALCARKAEARAKGGSADGGTPGRP
jgi:hypothetical protein